MALVPPTKVFHLLDKLILSTTPHLVIPVHVTEDEFDIQAHILTILHALTRINDLTGGTPPTFSITLLIPNQVTAEVFYQRICQWCQIFTTHRDDPTLVPPVFLSRAPLDSTTGFQPLLFPSQCFPPSSNPLQLHVQLQSALFHVLWAATNSTNINQEATQIFSIVKHYADSTNNLADDLAALTSPVFVARTFTVLQKALSKAQQDNLFFPEFFTHTDGLQIFSF